MASAKSVAGISEREGWTRIAPDVHGDWLNQRDDTFANFIAMGDKRGGGPAIFHNYSNGVKTQRDAWAYGFARSAVAANMKRMIEVYNSELERFEAKFGALETAAKKKEVDGFIMTDATRISWTRALKGMLVQGHQLESDSGRLVASVYRPFTKHWLYFDNRLNEIVGQIPRFYGESPGPNRLIGVSAGESRGGYAVLMVDVPPSLHSVDMVGSQFFPLHLHAGGDRNDEDASAQTELLSQGMENRGGRRDGITDEGLAHFANAYPREKITKTDLFYYIYGILYSEEYRGRFIDNLGRELPRIPRVKRAADFWAFSKAGTQLGDLHVGFEAVEPFPAELEIVVRRPGAHSAAKDGSDTPYGASAGKKESSLMALAHLDRKQLRVEKMKVGKKRVDGRSEKDLTTIHYNQFITVKGIPLEAWDYTVNGKPAIQWVMEQQAVKTDKASGIRKDPNDWATETADDPRYPLLLLLRVITVSLETINIVRSLPKLDILEN